jgi:hypothetical protein
MLRWAQMRLGGWPTGGSKAGAAAIAEGPGAACRWLASRSTGELHPPRPAFEVKLPPISSDDAARSARASTPGPPQQPVRARASLRRAAPTWPPTALRSGSGSARQSMSMTGLGARPGGRLWRCRGQALAAGQPRFKLWVAGCTHARGTARASVSLLQGGSLSACAPCREPLGTRMGNH